MHRCCVDEQAGLVLEEAAFTVYADNIVVVGTGPAEVTSWILKGKAAVEAAGLPTHVVETTFSEDAEVLGWKAFV